MRTTTRWRLALAGAVAVGAGLAGARAGLAGGGPECGGGLVVHEWGTFTSMQGSDGLVLEGLAAEEERLPGFVYSRAEVRECPLRDRGFKGLEVPADHVTQKMETPVLYFHSARPRRVRVRVDFVGGLITQWYPVSDLLGPPEGPAGAGPLDVSAVERSFLQWDVDVLPKGGSAPQEAPRAPADDPWSFAREVDASWLRTVPRKGPGRAGPVEAERYLFYRGLGAFPMPLSAVAEGGGKVRLRVSGGVSVEWAVVLQVEGLRGRFAVDDMVLHGAEQTVALPEEWAPLDEVVEQLRGTLVERLEKQGLRHDEAVAMVRTWARSWFRSEGTRVLWNVPRGRVDALLPLSIDPAPDELVRVLVGRLEVIPPEVEAEVERAVRDTSAEDAAVRASAESRLERLGRFLEPHLRNVLAKTRDPDVRRNAQALLAELRGAPR